MCLEIGHVSIVGIFWFFGGTSYGLMLIKLKIKFQNVGLWHYLDEHCAILLGFDFVVTIYIFYMWNSRDRRKFWSLLVIVFTCSESCSLRFVNVGRICSAESRDSGYSNFGREF